MLEMLPPLLAVVGIAVLVGPVMRAGARGDLDRHGAVGIRTRHTQASDAAWRAGHAAAATWVKWSTLVALITVMAGLALQWSVGDPFGVITALGGLLVHVIVLLLATRDANAAARAERAAARRR